MVGDPLAKRPRRGSEDVGDRGGDERRRSHRRAPRGEQHVHGRARPAPLRLAPELVRRQLLEPIGRPKTSPMMLTCSAWLRDSGPVRT